jgi:hypothetical protein
MIIRVMRWIALALIPIVAWLAGCSPVLNWREVRIEPSPLMALMPCKPDRAARKLDLAGEAVELGMTGCDAGGATFAVSQVRFGAGASAGAALTQWRVAMLANMRASDIREQPFYPAGSLDLPQSVRLSAAGQRADGSAVKAQAVWFARASNDGLWLFHAVIYADTLKPETADVFFGGLKLQGVP